MGSDLSRIDATLRIPSDHFDAALEELRSRGEVLREGVDGQDVTEQYSDLQAQLRSQKALEERILAILSRTESVEDALTVEKELLRVRSSIETLEGRSKLLEHQVDMATIHLTVVNPTQSNAPESETVASRLGPRSRRRGRRLRWGSRSSDPTARSDAALAADRGADGLTRRTVACVDAKSASRGPSPPTARNLRRPNECPR